LPNANPASVHSSTVATVMMLETTSEFHSASPMFCCWTAVAMLVNRSSPGSSGGGKTFISAIGLLAATSM
jgi:hypothetical protein